MKKKKLFDAMGGIDDKYVEEAATRREKHGKRTLVRITAIAACFALLLTGLNLWLFLPFDSTLPDVSQYADSEYYDIIQKLNVLTYRAPRYNNNFQRLTRGFMKFTSVEDAGANEMVSGTMDGGSQYVETTDNQVEGVIEADLIKRSDRYIYYMDNSLLRVLEIKGENTVEVGTYEIPTPDDAAYAHAAPHEFYLSTDCTTITYLLSFTSRNTQSALAIVSLDVTDPTAITQKNAVTLSGHYLSSRLVNGKLLLLNNFYVGYSLDFSDERTFIPQIKDGEGTRSIPMENIVSPDVLSAPRYTVVCLMDAETLEVNGTSAYLSYSENAYVSTQNIYVTRSYYEETKDGKYTQNRAMTEIAALSYADGALTSLANFTVEGEVKDQYSLDEYEGVLRVVTTLRTSQYEEKRDGNTVSMSGTNSVNAALYCVRLSDLEMLAKIERFAPEGESVRSVRFDGDAAYVCTSIMTSDPVFFFDLSDLSNVTVKDTGTIEGFSTSLIQFGDGFLVGIGVGENFSTVKIEVYEETATGVASVCAYEIELADYSENYKSYFIDRENGYVGLGYTKRTYDKDASRYVLLHFDKYNLNALADVPLAGRDYVKRGVVIDGYLYAFGENTFEVKKVTN